MTIGVVAVAAVVPAWVAGVVQAALQVQVHGVGSLAVMGVSGGVLLAALAVELPLCMWILRFVLRVLISIEHRGIRFFGKQRGWRVSAAVADTVCGHASVGWCVGGLLAGVMGVYRTVQHVAGFVHGENLSLTAGEAWLYLMPPVVAIGVTVVVGLLPFEILVYLGVRQCRFANPPETATQAEQP